MQIGALKETMAGETRVAMTPASAIELQKLGHDCVIQTGAGKAAGFSDQDYKAVGVTIARSAAALCKTADVVVKVRPPSDTEVKRLRADQTLISFFYPAQNDALLNAANDTGASIMAMDMVPRISRAQKLDALSSMANIAGYRAVIEAGNEFGRFFTGQITAAGKVPPAKVLVVGAGVAGLAAIGTATALGAQVYAFDVRPEVAEQIESMGAEFVYLDFDDSDQVQDGAATGGYAAPSSPEFQAKQLEKFRELAPQMDIVITTALIPGRDAPVLWTKEMINAQASGSVVVDLAAERGGNCELTQADARIVSKNGVIILGYTDLPARMAQQSSALYSTNIRHLLTDLTPDKDGVIVHDMDDDVIRAVTIAHGGAITFPPPPPKVQAIAAKSTEKPTKASVEPPDPAIAARKAGLQQTALLVIGGLLMALIGAYAPPSFMQHFIVFVLACFVGFQVIWNVNHALHTPLMAVTNAISGIIILGALLQLGGNGFIVMILAGISILIATINIVGGFMVTRRMLQMFQKS